MESTQQTRVFLLPIVLIALIGGMIAFKTMGAEKIAEVPAHVNEMFTKWTQEHNKVYSTPNEHFFRLGVFFANYLKVKALQQTESYEVAINAFADMTPAEFKAKFLGFRMTDRPRNVVLTQSITANPPAVDWRTKGIVNDVKDQGQCGSCWAFSTVAAIEGKWAQVKGKLVSLSEQQLVDCSTSYGNQGCNGGLMDQGFEYVKDKGITTEQAYPYKAVDGKCKYSGDATATITGHTDVAQNDGQALEDAAAAGVVSVAVDAQLWQFYSSGIMKSKFCGSSLDHGVAVVGYGSADSTDFWIVRNSWAATWGEKGYIRVLKSTTKGKGECGINMMASFPSVQ